MNGCITNNVAFNAVEHRHSMTGKSKHYIESSIYETSMHKYIYPYMNVVQDAI